MMDGDTWAALAYDLENAGNIPSFLKSIFFLNYFIFLSDANT